MNQFVVTIIFILLPGVVAAVVIDKLIVHSKWDSFKFTLYALLLGVLSYMALQFMYWGYDLLAQWGASPKKWTPLNFWTSIASEKPKVEKREVFLVTGLSLPVAFLVAWVVNFKFLNRVAQTLRVSDKYGDENLFSYFLNSKEIDWVYVRDIENNLCYQGRVVSYSENPLCQELVLKDVIVFRYCDSAELYSIEKLYISRELGKLIIESTE